MPTGEKQYNIMGMIWLILAVAVAIFIMQSVRFDSLISNNTQGTSHFLGLTDTPNTFSGHAGECAEVNTDEDAIVFENCTAVQAFLALTDTPNSFQGAANLAVAVSADGTHLIFRAFPMPSTSGNMPAGGTTNQLICKTSNVDYATQWCLICTINIVDDAITTAKIIDAAITLSLIHI